MDKTIIVAIISSGAFTTIVNFIINYLNQKRESKSNISKALMCLLGYEIKGECERVIRENKITMNDYQQLTELNDLYHEMGGNGYVKSLMDKVKTLSIE